RLQYCFAAQVAYMRTGLDPNAIALWRREMPAPMPDASFEDGDLASLLSATSTLGLNVAAAMTIAVPLRERSEALAREWDVESITNTIFAAVALVVAGCRELLLFLQYGGADRLALARNYFVRAITTVAGEGDLTSLWIATHL